jgi:hypothetical protein
MKFYVWVTRDITETCRVEVDAKDAADAEDIALGQRYTLNYETDDGIGETYVSNVEPVPEEEQP